MNIHGASTYQILQSLDNDQTYTVWLDGTSRLFRATGSFIKSLEWDAKTAERLRFSYTVWHHKSND